MKLVFAIAFAKVTTFKVIDIKWNVMLMLLAVILDNLFNFCIVVIMFRNLFHLIDIQLWIKIDIVDYV